MALMWPRHGVIDPAPVRAASYFSGTELERARDFRRPQVLLGLAAMAVELGLLALLVARPPRRLRGPFRRPILAAAVAGAALSVLVNAVPLPLQVVARQRAKDVGLVTQSWPGYAFDLVRSWAIGAVFAGIGAAIAVGLIRRMPRTLVDPGVGGRRRVRGDHDLRRPDRARPDLQPVHAAAGGADAQRRARPRREGRRRRRAGLRHGRQPAHDRGERLRQRARAHEARRALRQPARRLQPRRDAARRRPRARARPLRRPAAGADLARDRHARSACSPPAA